MTSQREIGGGRFDAVLFDAGGVLVLPDPRVLGPLLEPYGGDPRVDVHVRAHYAAMAAKSRAGAGELVWDEYDAAYVTAIGVPDHEQAAAAAALHATRSVYVWQHPVEATRLALAAMHELGVPIGVVSNAGGQIEAVLRRVGVCQVGDGPGVPVRCVVDSHVVGVAKPDPRIFEHALAHFDGIDRDRIAYVGDSITMDVRGSRAAGLTPVLIDPFDDHADDELAAALDGAARIRSVAELLG